MFTSGAKIDLKKIEEEIRKEIDEKRKRLFSDEELEELQKMELQILPNPDRVRPYFHQPLEFPQFDDSKIELPDPKFYNTDYNIDLNTFLASAPSSSGRLLTRVRNIFRPFFRLYGNIDALIHKQAQFNREQAQFNAASLKSIENVNEQFDKLEKPFHYIRVLHTLVNYLISEITKLSLSHQMLKAQVDALAYDLEQLRKRERLLETTAVLKEKNDT